MLLSRHIKLQLGKRIKKALVPSPFRAKQTNYLFLYVLKSADNCYFIRVDNKNPIFIPEKRKNRLNHFLKYASTLNNASVKMTNGLVSMERICEVTCSTKYELLLIFCFAVVALFRSSLVFVPVIGPLGVMQPY